VFSSQIIKDCEQSFKFVFPNKPVDLKMHLMKGIFLLDQEKVSRIPEMLLKVKASDYAQSLFSHF
jgi:hypothetical protein